jgi:hypothetical protein
VPIAHPRGPPRGGYSKTGHRENRPEGEPDRMRVIALTVALLALATPALAIPSLQVYIDGAVYNTDHETWVQDGSPFDLWVLGNVDGPGGHGAIDGVRLTLSFSGSGGTVTMTPKTTTTVVDPSTPPAPSFLQSGTGEHSFLPAHGIFNDDNMDHWEDFVIGDFTATDSPMADYISSVPTTFYPGTGQINVYSVTVTGWERVHFDAYNTVLDTKCKGGKNPVCTTSEERDQFAPFSHDAGGAPSQVVPEPTALLLVGVGMLVLGRAISRQRGRK